MVRPRALRVSLVVLLLLGGLGGCVGRQEIVVVDPASGCCVTKRYDPPWEGGEFASWARCTCSCDGGTCAMDQPYGPGAWLATFCGSAVSTVDLGCEARP